MDLSNLATKDRADEGVWTQAELYGEKQDFDICILGADSDAVKKFQRRQMKRLRLTGAGTDKLSDEALDALMEGDDEGAVARIAGLRPHSKGDEKLTLCGTELKSDEASYRLLVEKIPAVKEFVVRVSGERANFLQGRKKS